MKTCFAVVAALLSSQFFLLDAHPAKADPRIVSGKPCVSDRGLCKQFNENDKLDVIDTFSITSKSTANASISISGTMQCVNNNEEAGLSTGVIDLNGQIVRKGDDINAAKAGFSRFATRLPPPELATFSVPINLAVTRVFPLRSGRNDFQYKMSRNRMDPSTVCSILSLSFSAVVVD